MESLPALKFGLNAAIEEINNKGLGIIEKDIKKKYMALREKLDSFSQIIFYENKKILSGINTFNIEGFLCKKEIYNYLLSKNISSSISTPQSSMIYFKKKKKNLVELVRISIHSYNTINEINYLIKCLIDLIKNKQL